MKVLKAFLTITMLMVMYACDAPDPVSGASTIHNADKTKKVIVPPSLSDVYQQMQYAPAVRAGDMLYLSGAVAQHKDGEDIEVTIARAFDEIDLVLQEAGADWSNVVDVTSYLTDLDNQLGPLWEVKSARVPEPYPAWTAIGIDRLYGGDESILEIKVTAYLPE